MVRQTVLMPLYDNALNLRRVYVVSADVPNDSKPLLDRIDNGVREFFRAPGTRAALSLPPADSSPGLSIAEIHGLDGDSRRALDHVLNICEGVSRLEILDTLADTTADEKLGTY